MLNGSYELQLLSQGYSRVIGIDEVGRGALAGPVFVGAFEFSLDCEILEGVNDSKLVLPKHRATLSERLAARAKTYSRSVSEIDARGVGHALKDLIAEIISEYSSPETFFLIDGRFARDFGAKSAQIIKGDQLHYSIAAASIVAKVARDKLLRELSLNYPQYLWDRNKGYGTRAHRQILAELGPTPEHRRSFLRNFL